MKRLILLFSMLLSILSLTTQAQRIILLPEIEFEAPAVIVNNDTLTYNVSVISSSKDKSLEDLLRKLPGIEISGSGRITYDGKPISHFYIEGVDLLGQGYSLATQNIRPEDLQVIQVLEHHQPIRILKGYVPSDRAAINVRLKKSRLSKPIGYAQAAVGKESDVAGHIGTHLMNVEKKRQQLLYVSSSYQDNTNNRTTNIETGSTIDLKNGLSEDIFATSLFRRPEIATNRYQSERNANAGYNILIKKSDDLIYKVNASYQASRNAYSQEAISHLAVNDGLLERDEHNTSVYHKQLVLLNVEAENNTPNLYLKHISALRYDRSDNDYTLISQQQKSSVTEQISMPRLDYKNTTEVIFPFGENQMMAHLSMSYTNRPSDQMNFTSLNDTLAPIVGSQGFEGNSLAIQANTAYQFSFDAYRQMGIEVQADFLHESLSSDYRVNQLPQYANQLKANVGVITATPFFKGEWGMTLLKVDIPIEWRIASFSKVTGEEYRYNMPNIYGNISLTERISRTFSINMSVKKNRTFGSSFDFMSAPIQTSYIRSTRLGTDKWSTKKNLLASLSFIYKNAMEGKNAVLTASYRQTRNSTMRDVSVDKTEDAITVFDLNNTLHNFNGNLSASKNYYDKKLVFTVNASVGVMQNSYLRSGKKYDISSFVQSYIGSISKTLLNDKLSVDMSAHYSVSNSLFKRVDNLGSRTSNQTERWTSRLGVTASPLKGWSVYSHFDAQWTHTHQWLFDKYLDGGISWKYKQHEINLALSNLLNQKQWRSNEIVDIDQYIYTYDLNPLEIMIGYKHIF